jgi:hypothetical protein
MEWIDAEGALSPDGRYLFRRTDRGALYHDLHGAGPATALVGIPHDVSPAAGLWAFYDHPDAPHDMLLSLRLEPAGRPWLTLGNDDLSAPTPVRFSPDGRYLVWGSQSGMLTVVDLPALKKEVAAFEESLRTKSTRNRHGS